MINHLSIHDDDHDDDHDVDAANKTDETDIDDVFKKED